MNLKINEFVFDVVGIYFVGNMVFVSVVVLWFCFLENLMLSSMVFILVKQIMLYVIVVVCFCVIVECLMIVVFKELISRVQEV